MSQLLLVTIDCTLLATAYSGGPLVVTLGRFAELFFVKRFAGTGANWLNPCAASIAVD